MKNVICKFSRTSRTEGLGISFQEQVMAKSPFYFLPKLIYNRVLYLSSKLLRMCSVVQLQKPTFLFFIPRFLQFEFFYLFFFLAVPI
jgi:hypothetical protein